MRIKFIAQGANTMFGGFSHGDIANVSDALARHLVEEAKVAEYAKVEQKAQEQPKPVLPRKGKA